MTYAFSFDASSCSGCKACQEACKDKNNLPVGVIWRRVIEVSGGEWYRTGGSWENNVFAYHLSLACNHCRYPKCAGVCPTDAFSVRADGVVLLDSSKCMGCGYCAWACPYGAPQYNASKGVMTKCDFCYDNLDTGQPPACVSACPLRVLDFEPTEDPDDKKKSLIALWKIPANEHPFPLASYSRTEPRLSNKRHPGMDSALGKTVANFEEIQTKTGGKLFENPAFNELPLVAFTLLLQMAVGMTICLLAVLHNPLSILFDIGLVAGIGGLASFLHLGRKRNAWRALNHLKKSWLSRETLLTCLFATAWLVTFGLEWFLKVTITFLPMALIGCGLIYSMAQIYRLRTVEAWNSWRTPVTFFLSAVVLGTLGVNINIPASSWEIIAGIAMAVELCLVLEEQSLKFNSTRKWRIISIAIGLLGIFFLDIFPRAGGSWSDVAVFLIALAAETIGRQQFYARRIPNPL